MEDYFTDFFKGTVKTTYDRCVNLETKLNSVEVKPLLNEYVINLKNDLSSIKTKLNELLQDPSFGNEFLINQHLSRYYRLSRQLSLLESYPITVLSRYNEDDYYFFNLMRIFNQNINYPYNNPLVSTYCMTYYASQPRTELLIVPSIERNFLLDTPFILHELGHIILHKKEQEILNIFIEDLRKYIRDKKYRVEEEDRSSEYINLFNNLEVVWEESWSKEFASDIIATYLLGPAYAWAYLKICNRFYKDIYVPGKLDDISSDHPSHEARMRCIFEGLNLLEIDITQLKNYWDEYIRTIRENPPQEYEYCYPDHLLKSLAKNVLDGCKNIGLKNYKEQRKQGSNLNLVILVNESFKKFLENPSGYRKWEIKQIKEINDNIVNYSK